MRCSKCDADLGGFERRAAFVAMEVMGDEYIDSYWSCAACGAYTKETYHDRFLGEASASVSGPISKEKGDEIVRTIGRCPSPHDKRCDCEAHRILRGGW